MPDEIRQQLEQAGLGRLADIVVPQALPSLGLIIGKPSTKPVSRLGGHPNLPQEFPWPLRENGQPLSFLAQLDLAGLPAIDGLPLPKEGSLFFFYDVEDMPWGFDPKDNDCSRVIYSPAALTASKARTPHEDLDEEFCFEGTALTAGVETTLPSLDRDLLREYEITSDEFSAYAELLDASAGSRLGGHPNEIQGDLRLEAQMVSHGLYCGDGTGYAEGAKRGLEKGAADWRLLLQVDSEEEAGMMWGDAGRIYFLIREEDLRGLKFDGVWLGLQCG